MSGRVLYCVLNQHSTVFKLCCPRSVSNGFRGGAAEGGAHAEIAFPSTGQGAEGNAATQAEFPRAEEGFAC